jgi:hypothetical protein
MSTKEIYLRDSTDPKYDPNKLEEENALEILLSKIRIILYSNRGDVLGEPELGMDLEENLFDFNISPESITRRFYAQLAKYVSETDKFDVDMSVDIRNNGVQFFANIIITIDNQPMIGMFLKS